MNSPVLYPTAGHSGQNDLDRIEEIGADAMEAARQALSQMVLISDPQLMRSSRDLDKIVADRSALTQTSRLLIGDALAVLRPLIEADATGRIGIAYDHLARCLSRSERVADLLAAERYVGFCRGIE